MNLIEVATCDCDNLYWLDRDPAGNGHDPACPVPVALAAVTIRPGNADE